MENTLKLKRGREIVIEVYDDGSIGLELSKEHKGEYQTVYFELTRSELQMIINRLANAQQTRTNLLRRLKERVVNG